jgi:hypothetical protein
VFQYLMNTADRGILFGENSGKGVEIFTDATCASDRETRRSQSGVLVFYHGDLIEWKSKRQQSVALSSAESELMAATLGVTEGLWIRTLAETVEGKDMSTMKLDLKIDSQAAIGMMRNPVHFAKSKHIEIRYFFCRELHQAGELEVEYVRTTENLADVMTKSLRLVEHWTFSSQITQNSNEAFRKSRNRK